MPRLGELEVIPTTTMKTHKDYRRKNTKNISGKEKEKKL